MTNSNLRMLLSEAKHEIQSLRRQNELLRAKVDMIELFDRVLSTQPAIQTQSVMPDVAYALENAINDLAQSEAV